MWPIGTCDRFVSRFGTTKGRNDVVLRVRCAIRNGAPRVLFTRVFDEMAEWLAAAFRGLGGRAVPAA